MYANVQINESITARARHLYVKGQETRRSEAAKLPLKKLKAAKIVNGELVGQSFIVPGSNGKKTTDVSARVYKEAAKQAVKVTLREFPDGVRVYRLGADILSRK